MRESCGRWATVFFPYNIAPVVAGFAAAIVATLVYFVFIFIFFV